MRIRGLFCLMLALFAWTAFAEDSGARHNEAGMIVLDDFEVAERQRVQYLWSLTVCACPKENWSKTLANCPDGCADPQKQEIMAQVAAEWTNDQVLDYQEQTYSGKARAKPNDLMTYLLPVLVLLGSLGVLFVMWSRWTTAAAARSTTRPKNVEAGEVDAIERELRELD